ncbi:hypothetical protein [Fusobacterium sp.]|uniref:hypothetical protein n=1 Tax=Fusobacterium sp. TaxID=68766 RepID=UPI0029020E47|nr:hypothetical protein [Fusobacterium sp.]MDU1909709.1 hypothetical protein [Fusobacterium sp.]
MKARKLNYKTLLKHVEAVQKEIKIKEKPVLILIEKLSNGSYSVAETSQEHKRKDFIIKNEKQLNKYIELLNKDNCIIIIDDMIEMISEDMYQRVIKECTTEELHLIIETLENKGDQKVIDKIFKDSAIKMIRR